MSLRTTPGIRWNRFKRGEGSVVVVLSPALLGDICLPHVDRAAVSLHSRITFLPREEGETSSPGGPAGALFLSGMLCVSRAIGAPRPIGNPSRPARPPLGECEGKTARQQLASFTRRPRLGSLSSSRSSALPLSMVCFSRSDTDVLPELLLLLRTPLVSSQRLSIPHLALPRRRSYSPQAAAVEVASWELQRMRFENCESGPLLAWRTESTR